MSKHTKWVASLGCVLCGGYAEAAHVKVRSDGRLDGHTMGKKPKVDGVDLVVPLCARHHRLEKESQHSMNEGVFWEYHGIDAAKMARELVNNSGDTEKAMGLLGGAARERLMA